MAIGIDPTVDFAFKKILGSPEHPSITLHFLNAILSRGPKITEVEILNPILDKDFDEDKLSILDIRARDEHDRLLNIEIQRTRHDGLADRLTYYAASLYVGQLGEGENYGRLNPAIGICVLDDLLFKEVPDLHHEFRLRSENRAVCLTDRLEIHLLELPKYVAPSDNRLITDPIEQWCFFLRRVKDLTVDEISRYLGAVEFTEATGILEMIARSPDEREQYEARLKFQRDAAWRLEAARKEGKAEGIAEGEARGEARGRVRALQDLLQLPDREDLDSLSRESLATLEADLQRQLRERGIG